MNPVGAVSRTISATGWVAVVATCGLLVGACGSSSSSAKSQATPSPSPSPRATLITSVDACTLVPAADASTAAGTTVSSLGGAGSVSVPGACIYGSSDGTTSVFVIATAYPDATSAASISPEQLAAGLNGYGIANAKVVTGIGDKAVEYTVTNAAASGSTGAVIFVFKSNVVIMIAISPLTDTKKLEDLARTAVGNLH